jgi:hypothetical protein
MDRKSLGLPAEGKPLNQMDLDLVLLEYDVLAHQLAAHGSVYRHFKGLWISVFNYNGRRSPKPSAPEIIGVSQLKHCSIAGGRGVRTPRWIVGSGHGDENDTLPSSRAARGGIG